MTHVWGVADETILEAVHEALDNDDCLAFGGGVRPKHVAMHCELQPGSLRDRLLALSTDGHLVRVWGVDTDQPGYPARRGYLPAEHPAATAPYSLPVDQ